DGTYTAQAEQSDDAHNTAVSAAHTFTIKTASPAVTLDPVPTPSNNATPTLKGEAGNANGDGLGVLVTVYEGGSPSGKVVLSETVSRSGSAWSYTTTHLSDGTYTAQVSQEDVAGNVGTSLERTFTIDTTPPAVSLSAPGEGAFSGTSKPTFSGAAGNASGDSSTVTLHIYQGSSTSGTPQTVSLTRSGASWSYTPGTPLADGTYTAQAEQSDEAHNTAVSAAHTFTVKTASPAVTLDPPPALSREASPTFSGGAGTAGGDDPSVTLKVYAGESVSGSPLRTLVVTPSGGSWSAGPVATLPDGTYTTQAEQSDEAANRGVSESHTFTIDTTPPKVTLDGVPTPRNDPTPQLEGEA
ncbi:MAG TPA: Ig-like domain-containing protein, partial [Mycobacteriales bacterium]|nr:Ig-like domain-containing protein [Mycobacteriales bacterium]